MTVGRLLRRASSTPQFTATVVVPAPPFAPKNTRLVAVGLAPCDDSRRAAVRRIAPWNVSSAGGQVKNSFAPARIDDRMTSGSAVCATAKMPAPGDAARRRSIPAIADSASPRMSTMTTSGVSVSRAESMTLTGTAPARSSFPICFLNPSSSLTMSPTSCAMDYCFFALSSSA